jgi:hypothetical protein
VEHLAVGRDELDREQVVDGQPVLGHQPAEAAAERKAGDARRGDHASGHDQPVLGGSVVQLTPDHTALRGGGRLFGIDRDPLHLGEVDHQAAVRHSAAGDVVATAADRDLEPGSTRERERRDDVVGRPAAGDQAWPAVDEAVVEGTRRVIAVVVRSEDGPGDLFGEVGCERGVQGCAHETLPSLGEDQG